MLKALIKKQLLELNQFYFTDKKTGKHRGKAGTILFTLLFAFLLLVVALAFFGIAGTLGEVLIPAGLGNLYYALMGILSVLFGVFGSVFNTYAGLYLAKDNDLLISMPIPPGKILFARMIGVYLMSLLYSGLMWVPAIVFYLLKAGCTAAAIVNPILLLFLISLLVTALTCFFGWIVADITRKTKGKNFFTVIISLVFFAAYYMFSMNMMNFLTAITDHAEGVEKVMRVWLFPFNQLGSAAAGSITSLLLFALISAAAYAVCHLIMTRSFIRIATMPAVSSARSGKKAVVSKQETANTALFRRELKHFTSLPLWMLNTGLGVIIMPVIAIVLAVKSQDVGRLIAAITPELPAVADYIPLAILCVFSLICAMDSVTSCSISLEGRNVWILQTLPVDLYQVLLSKERVHILINSIPMAVSVLVTGIVLDVDPTIILLLIAAEYEYIRFTADLGLFMNLKKPNMVWTSETVPIKQGAALLFSLLFGVVLALCLPIGGYFALKIVNTRYYLLIVIVALALLIRLLQNWLKQKGAEIFAHL